jgi:hypothetical protein
MKPALLSRFVRSSRHLDAEPCRNCGTVYFGNFCNECGQEAYTGAPTALGFIYEFLTRNLFERGKVHRTMWQLVRHPGGLTVDFLEGRRQRFIRPVRLYFVLSVLYFLLLSFQNSSVMNYVRNPAPAPAATTAPATEKTVPAAPAAPSAPAAQGGGWERKPTIVMGPLTINPNAGKKVEGSNSRQEAMFTNFPYDKDWEKYPAWQKFKQRDREFTALPDKEREAMLYRIVLEQAPKAMFFLVPVFALILKCLFILRGIPYGAHLLFAFHYHCYVFFMLLLMMLPVHPALKAIAGLSMPWYLMASMRTTYQVWWIGAALRLLALAILYSIAMAIAFIVVLLMGFLL